MGMPKRTLYIFFPASDSQTHSSILELIRLMSSHEASLGEGIQFYSQNPEEPGTHQVLHKYLLTRFGYIVRALCISGKALQTDSGGTLGTGKGAWESGHVWNNNQGLCLHTWITHPKPRGSRGRGGETVFFLGPLYTTSDRCEGSKSPTES